MAGRTGRPPKPTALKVVEGTERADRRNPTEPKPPQLEVGAAAPTWLRDDKARRAWAHLSKLLTEQGILSVLDSLALGMLCDAFADYLAAGDRLRRDGYYRRTGSGKAEVRGLMAHPAVRERRYAWMRIERMLTQFGMTPSARVRVSALPGEEIDPTEAFLDGRGTGAG